MPIYELRCGNCGFEEERMFPGQKSFGEYACPKCGVKNWIKKPCRTAWFLGKRFIQKDAASQVAEMGYGKPT